MPAGVGDQERLRRYLLDELPPEEQAEVEERYFREPDLLDTLRITEDDLIHDYLRGRLAPETRARFEACYLTSPARRDRVEFSARLVDRAGRARRQEPAAPAHAHRVPPRSWARGREGARAAAWGALAVAGLLFALARWPGAPSVDAPGSGASPRTRSGSTRGPSPSPPTGEPPAPWTLSAGRTRGGATGVAVMVAAGTPTVAFRLRVTAPPAPSYHVRLRSAEGSELRRFRGLAPDRAGEEWALVVVVPGALLAPGDYVLELRPAAGRAADAGAAEYFFRVTHAPPGR